jgi:hypothetical protein
MRSMVVVLCLTIPGLLFGQSLADVAKKEKDRREKNKEKGKAVHVVSESELAASRPAEQTQVKGGSESGESTSTPSSSSSTTEGVNVPETSGSSESSEDEASVPKFIPPDRPLPEKLAMFDQMKRHYESQVQEIDKQIGENEARLRQIESDIAATSALGGAGLPVPPQTGTGAATRPMTGQESASLVGEQNRLQTMNQQLQQRKVQLKMDLVAKGQSAGIPAGYLRF